MKSADKHNSVVRGLPTSAKHGANTSKDNESLSSTGSLSTKYQAHAQIDSRFTTTRPVRILN
jgi:hypothetical protein